jgi:ribokinase
VPEARVTPNALLVLQMEVPFAQSLALARRMKAATGTVVWNLAPVPEQMGGELIRDLLAVTDYLITNEHEARDAASALGTPAPDFAAAAAALAQAGRLTCIVTAGAQGAFAFTSAGARIHAPSMTITPVDTTGAGDTLVGAFAAMLDEKAPLQRALEIACEAAALKCLRAGAQDGMPVRSEIRSFGG